MGIVLLRENKPVGAEVFLKRALDAGPSSWRAHALLAEACLRQGLLDESVRKRDAPWNSGMGALRLSSDCWRKLLRNGETPNRRSRLSPTI